MAMHQETGCASGQAFMNPETRLSSWADTLFLWFRDERLSPNLMDGALKSRPPKRSHMLHIHIHPKGEKVLDS